MKNRKQHRGKSRTMMLPMLCWSIHKFLVIFERPSVYNIGTSKFLLLRIIRTLCDLFRERLFIDEVCFPSHEADRFFYQFASSYNFIYLWILFDLRRWLWPGWFRLNNSSHYNSDYLLLYLKCFHLELLLG